MKSSGSHSGSFVLWEANLAQLREFQLNIAVVPHCRVVPVSAATFRM